MRRMIRKIHDLLAIRVPSAFDVLLIVAAIVVAMASIASGVSHLAAG